MERLIKLRVGFKKDKQNKPLDFPRKRKDWNKYN